MDLRHLHWQWRRSAALQLFIPVCLPDIVTGHEHVPVSALRLMLSVQCERRLAATLIDSGGEALFAAEARALQEAGLHELSFTPHISGARRAHRPAVRGFGVQTAPAWPTLTQPSGALEASSCNADSIRGVKRQHPSLSRVRVGLRRGCSGLAAAG